MKIRKLISVLLTLVLFVTMGAVSASAASGDGSITITPISVKDHKTIVKGSSFELYQVGTPNGNGFTLTGNFTGSQVSLSNWTDADVANSLLSYANRKSLKGVTKSANSAGIVTFDYLADGLYLVTQNNVVAGYEQVVPFLISIPYESPTDGGLTYSAKAYPKVEPDNGDQDKPSEPSDPTGDNEKPGDSDNPGGSDNPSNPSNPGGQDNTGGSGEDNSGKTPGSSGTENGTNGGDGNNDNSSTGNGGNSSGNSSNNNLGNTGTTGGNDGTNGGTGNADSGSGSNSGNGPIAAITDTVNEALAQTGQLKWPILFLTGFGLLLLAIGTYNVKKTRKNSSDKKAEGEVLQ